MEYSIYLELHIYKDKDIIEKILAKLNIHPIFIYNIKFKESLIYDLSWKYVSDSISLISDTSMITSIDHTVKVYTIYFKSEEDKTLFRLKYEI